MTTAGKHQKSHQPIQYFYRSEPALIMFLIERKLTPIQVRFFVYFMLGMDRENIFETRECLTEHLSQRFDYTKNRVLKIFKEMRELSLCEIVGNKKSPKAIRINPYIVNKVQKLTGFWEFEDIKLGAIAEEYNAWRLEQNLPKDIVSYWRLEKGKVIMQERADSAPTDTILLKKHEAIVKKLQDENARLIEEYAKDCETFIAEREELLMRIDRLEEELKYYKDDVVGQINLKMDAILAELRKYNPEKADEFEKKECHLRVVREDDYQTMH